MTLLFGTKLQHMVPVLEHDDEDQGWYPERVRDESDGCEYTPTEAPTRVVATLRLFRP